MKKRILSILLVACMVVGLLPAVALATTTGTYGAFSVTYDGAAPTYVSNTLTLGSGTYTISGTTTADKIVVASGAAVDITLSSVNIDVSSTADACAFDMAGATANITLSGTNTLKSGIGTAGLRVPTDADLTITAQSTGSLVATAANKSSTGPGAGIGGKIYEDCGAVTINGGTVSATGGGSGLGYSGAGIGGGGGYHDITAGSGGTITINGGTVTASGAENSAGIGGGGSGSIPAIGGPGGTVTINGGTVIANGGSWRGAGIGGGGGGFSGNGATVAINGGSVKSSGGGTGIGAGKDQYNYPGTNDGTLKNASGTDVQLYTLTLSGVSSVTAVEGLSATPSLGYAYGITDMTTDADGKLYVYLPAGKTAAGVTTAAGSFWGGIISNAANLSRVFSVSGTVSAGAIGASVSGLTVNLYASTDTAFSTSKGSATTDGSGAYSISGVPNGSYVARVAGVSGSYGGSVSSTITVSSAPVSGADITLAALTTQSIRVKAGSQKISYVVNDLLDVTNLKITVTRNDGSTYDKDVTADMVSGFDSSAVIASLPLTITFDGKSNTYYISVGRAAYSGSIAPTPTLISKTGTQVTLSAVTVTGQTVEYGKNTSNTTPTVWQDGTTFTGLTAGRTYYFFARVKQTALIEAGGVSTALPVTTKTAGLAAPGAPVIGTGGDGPTSDTITINTVTGCQYAITTSDTAPTIWGVAETTNRTKIFSSLSAATRYYIWVRVVETDTAMPSASSRISVYTTAAAPSAEGYTIDYSAETIGYDDDIYEITADTIAMPLVIIGSGDSIMRNISDYSEAAQKIYVRIKSVENGAPAGAWAEITLPARPATPSASASDETVDNKNDGRIFGVTEAMEWKAAGGFYTVVTAEQALNGITGLSDGIYYVRRMAVSGTGFKSAEQQITIAAGHTITVTFNSQSGSDVAGISGKAYDDQIAVPVAPIRSGFYFAGWYKDVFCTNPWTFTMDELTDDITLFAKWSAIPAYTVTGRIVDETSIAVEGATVRMIQGATQFGTTGVTDTNGDFTINEVPPGSYNLVIAKGTKTSIVKVEVSGGNVAIGNATLPSGNANSILVVQGSGTPNVVVGELDKEADTQLAGSGNPLADKVDITLTVEKKDAAMAANGSEVTGTVTAAGKQVGMILAIDVNKKVNGTDDPSYNQTSGLIEINIPLPVEMQGKATYAIYRYHGAAVDTITETPNGDLERIVVDRTNWTITLFAKKFSTYAIGYTNPSSSRGGSGGVATNVAGTTSAAIENPKNVALPYYVANGKEIFIGFAMDASGTMKYIALEGVTVLFRENPKSFHDIAGHWAKGNIDFVTEREIFLGAGNGNFSPQSGMTRAMFATVIGRIYERSYGELSKKEDSYFTDVDGDAYYRVYTNWASENNIITGIGGGLFKPDQEITRQEMAAILYRFATFLKALPADSEKAQLNYPDAAEISSWAAKAAVYSQQTGIITGRSGGNFVPQGTATRAEVAAILQRFIENTVK